MSFVAAKTQQNYSTGTGNYNSKATRQEIICEVKPWPYCYISKRFNCVTYLGTIHLRRQQIFTNFRPLPPYRRQFFSTIRWQICQIFDPSPLKTCRRLKWMVPYVM